MTRLWLDFLIAATASLSGSAVRATMATSAPEAANRAATARPIPLLPPVTTAARRERLISIASSQTRVSAVPHSKPSEHRSRSCQKETWSRPMAPLDVAFVRQGNNIARAQYARECAVVVGDHLLVFRRTKCRIAGRFVGEAIDGIMHALIPRAPAAPSFLAFENA